MFPTTLRAMLRTAPQTIYDLVSRGAARAPGAPALTGPVTDAVSYGVLLQQLRAMGTALHGVGIGRNNPVIVALPSGTEAVVATLGVAAYATAVPVDPAKSREQLASLFDSLDPAAVLAPAGESSHARAIAYNLGTMVIEVEGLGNGLIRPCTATTGCSAVALPAQPNNVAIRFPRPESTTGLLTHGRLLESGVVLAESLNIAVHHRCMNLVPMWERAASIIEMCATLFAGACVVCPPVVRAQEFLTWLDLCRPTWFSADARTQREIIELARANPAACVEAVELESADQAAADSETIRPRTFLTRLLAWRNEA